MPAKDPQILDQSLNSLFPETSEIGAFMRAFDWSKTALGRPEQWPPTLRTITRMLLANCFPMLLWWGPDFLQIYNDAYAPILGDKHPHAALGKPFRECWAEVFPILGPLAQTPFEGGPATWVDDNLCEVNRYGFVEETHFTIAYSPVPAEEAPSGIGGVLATVKEITSKVVGERRNRLLRDIGASAREGDDAEKACIQAAEALKSYPLDLPFVLLYLIDAQTSAAHLAGIAGAEPRTSISPETISLEFGETSPWNFRRAAETEQAQIVQNLGKPEGLPAGPWSDPPRQAIVLPIQSNTAHQPAGFMVAGLSLRLAFDDAYRVFVELAASQIATIIASARAHEEECKRAEALAEIDRAKTVFFSNVSHEFRTPLTLIMGPLEETIAHPALPDDVRVGLELARRNSLRLQKLVNNLLDFSRIEAGRVGTNFEPLDLARYTEELTSGFQSAFERAGLWLRCSMKSLSSPVSVDREMWEKIVLNLLSNALKFTLTGGVTVEVQEQTGSAQLVVSDTGIGIAREDLSKIFNRFERIEGARGRSAEGSGIGLALVQELVKLHHGSIAVESEEGMGTRFTVNLPMDSSNRPSVKEYDVLTNTRSTASPFNAYLTEALDWISEPSSHTAPKQSALKTTDVEDSKSASSSLRRILIADDNADMRRYISRLLENYFDIETVSNGQKALASIESQRPDLLLSDVMMPEMDGLSLLRAIRQNPSAASLPIILLSAKAGQEASIEGFDAGADDYLVKPFSASELVARVNSVLKLTDVRNSAERSMRIERTRLLDLFREAPAFMAVLSGPHHVIEMTNPLYDELVGHRDVLGKPVREAIPEALEQGFVDLLDRVYESGEAFSAHGIAINLMRKSSESLERRYLDFVYQPIREAGGVVSAIIVVGVDVTERKEMENALQDQRERFSFATSAARVGYWFCDLPFAELIWDNCVKEHFWLPSDAHVTIETFYECIHPDDREHTRCAIDESIQNETTYDTEYRTVAADGRFKWIRAIGRTAYDSQKTPIRFDGITIDVTQQRIDQLGREATSATQKFLLKLSDKQRSATNGREIMQISAELLGRHLNVGRVGYSEATPDMTSMVFETGWAQGELKTLSGSVPMNHWSEDTSSDFSRGRTVVYPDVRTEPSLVSEVDNYTAIGAISVIAVPFLRRDVWRGSLYVNDSRPRQWTSQEVSLVEEVAQRTAESVERAQAEEELRSLAATLLQEQEHLRLTLLATLTSAFSWDLEKDFVRWTGRAPFGRDAHELTQPAVVFALIHSDDRIRVQRTVQEAREDRPGYTAEYRGLWPDGSVHWIQSSGIVLRNAQGTAVRILGIDTDITERKLAAEALLRTEKLAAVGRLASSIAHEINNPLESVTNLIYLVRSAPEISEETQQHMEIADRELRRVSNIASQTLRFHKQAAHPTACTGQKLFRDTLSIYQGRTINSQIQIVERHRSEESIECFEGEIRQVLSNLVSNAIDAMPRGGRLLLRSRETTQAKSGKRGLYLTIADTGTGMSSVVRSRVFEAFYSTKGIG